MCSRGTVGIVCSLLYCVNFANCACVLKTCVEWNIKSTDRRKVCVAGKQKPLVLERGVSLPRIHTRTTTVMNCMLRWGGNGLGDSDKYVTEHIFILFLAKMALASRNG